MIYLMYYLYGVLIGVVVESINMGYNHFETKPLEALTTAILWPIMILGLIGRALRALKDG